MHDEGRTVANIFLSYARADKERARVVAAALEARGLSVWWDGRIPPGKDFRDHIQEQLDKAACVAVLWSKASVASHFVREEAKQGMANGRLVPAFIETVRLPLGFGEIQIADLSTWNGQSSHDEFDRFITSIQDIVGRPADYTVPPIVRNFIDPRDPGYGNPETRDAERISLPIARWFLSLDLFSKLLVVSVGGAVIIAGSLWWWYAVAQERSLRTACLVEQDYKSCWALSVRYTEQGNLKDAEIYGWKACEGKYPPAAKWCEGKNGT